MRMLRIMLLAVVALAMGTVAEPAQAQTEGRLPITEKTTRQKAQFVVNLVSHSAASRLIESSNDAEAKQTLAQARSMVERANAALASGDFAAANKTINEVVTMMTAATRRLSKDEVGSAHATKVFASRKDSVVAIMEAYDRVAQEKGANQGLAAKRRKVDSYLSEAVGLKEKGDIKGATAMLEQAYTLATAITKELRDGDTLVRELKFDGPEDEYLYEVDRNDSHFFLLDLTVKEKNPHPRFLEKIDSLRVEAEALRKEAEAQAAQGAFVPAMDKLGESTKKLIKAIRMGGNFIPG